MSISRRKFMTGVAAGVATALAGPEASADLYFRGKPLLVTAHDHVLYPYQTGIDFGSGDSSVICVARQMGKTSFIEDLIEYNRLNPERVLQQIKKYY